MAEPHSTGPAFPACPMCAAPMEGGALAVYASHLTFSRVVWEAATDKILSGRVVTLFRPGFLGSKKRQAWRCTNCGAVLVPPDPG